MAEAKQRTVEFGWKHRSGRWFYLLKNRRWINLKTSKTGKYLGDLHFNESVETVREYFFMPEEYLK